MRVQRCPCITDMRSACCGLNIQASSPERRQTKVCGEPNLYEFTAEKDAVQIPQTRSRLTLFKPFGHALKIRACRTNKNRRMYKTKASPTQGSFCLPINLNFLRRQRRFFHFSLPGAAEIRHAQSSAALFWERLYSSAVISILETAYSVCPL